jgi:Immunity protein 50
VQLQPSKVIVGSDSVISLLGYWPSFHDAEVISFFAERAAEVTKNSTVAKLCVHVRTYVSHAAGTAQYKQILKSSVLVNFIFQGARTFELSDFNHQNVINAIEVTETSENGSPALIVEIESIWGFGGTLVCDGILVSAVSLSGVPELGVSK